MLAWFAAALLGAAVFYIIYVTQVSAETSAAKDRLGVNWGTNDKPFIAPFYLRLTKPLLKGGTLDIAVNVFPKDSIEYWRKRIRTAGLHKFIQPEHFLASRFWLGLILFAFMFLIVLFKQEPPPLWSPFVIGIIGVWLPTLDINSRRQARQNNVRLGMPYVLDLMTLTMEAGLEFQGAITRVVERAPPGPFIEELSELLKDIQLGKSRAEALRKMADAIDISEITSLVAVLISTDKMGSPVGPVLRAQSETLRVERLVKAEKLGAQASQKILIPLVFFILPAVFLIIFGPIVLQALGVR